MKYGSAPSTSGLFAVVVAAGHPCVEFSSSSSCSLVTNTEIAIVAIRVHPAQHLHRLLELLQRHNPVPPWGTIWLVGRLTAVSPYLSTLAAPSAASTAQRSHSRAAPLAHACAKSAQADRCACAARQSRRSAPSSSSLFAPSTGENARFPSPAPSHCARLSGSAGSPPGCRSPAALR